MHSRSPWLVVALVCVFAGTLGTPAVATVVTGHVTDGAGPADDATVEVFSPTVHHVDHTTAEGAYSLNTPSGNYQLAVTPKAGSGDRFAVRDLSVDGTGPVVADVVLSTGASGAGSLSGTATYPDGAPAAGIEVDIWPFADVGFSSPRVRTDAHGRWTAPSVATGVYSVLAIVEDANRTRTTQATRYVAVDGGQSRVVDLPLSGPPGVGFGTITGRVSAAGLPAAWAQLTNTPPGGDWPYFADAGLDGTFTLDLPAGDQVVNLLPGDEADAAASIQRVHVVAGETATVDAELAPLPIPAGARARGAVEAVASLNAERRRWGLPAQVVEAPAWSDACAAHDAYLKTNELLEHPERNGLPGYSPGGNWAGTHAVLSGGSGAWTAERNPWEDAPYHLAQLLAPNISFMGVDDSSGACATTWPGMRSGVMPVGTVSTYPGNGTTGLPPAERAAELPSVPGDEVGLPQGTLTGRHLFVYEETASPGDRPRCGSAAPFTNASLTGPGGPVDIRTLDAGGFSPAGIIIPVKPLAAQTTYEASASLAAIEHCGGVPAVTYRWSFTTGAANPEGAWPFGEDPGDDTTTVTGPPAARVGPWLRSVLRATTTDVGRPGLRRRGAVSRVVHPVAEGVLRVTWTARHQRLASGRVRLAEGATRLRVRLTTAGRRLLHRRRPLRVRARGAFGRAAARRTFVL